MLNDFDLSDTKEKDTLNSIAILNIALTNQSSYVMYYYGKIFFSTIPNK